MIRTLVILLSCASGAAAGIITPVVTVRVIPADTTLQLTDTVTLDIRADISAPVIGWGLDVMLSGPGAVTLTSPPTIGPDWNAAPSNDADGLAGLAFPDSVVGSDVLLAQLEYRGTAIGEVSVTIGVTAGDLNEGFALDPTGFAATVFESGTIDVLCTQPDADGDGIGDACDDCPGGRDTANISATVVLDAVFPGVGGVPEPLTRCIRFVATNGMSGACTTPVDLEVDFFAGLDGVATATVTIPDVDCGSGGLTHLCAKDEQYTLWDTVELLNVNSNNVTVTDLVLLGGDTNNDGLVEMNDATYLVAHWSEADPGAKCPVNGQRGADFSHDGSIGVEDYTFLSAHWLLASSCACALGNTLDSVVINPDGARAAANIASASVAIRDLPVDIRQKVDLHRDGIFDHKDMRLFEIRHALPESLSAKMRGAEVEEGRLLMDQPLERASQRQR